MDVCRQSIVFNEIADIAACLRVIGADRDVRLVRVKNRLNPEYHSSISAGYRDVALNLCIVTDDTRDLGVDNHICELQLILRSIAELKVGDPYHPL